MNRESKSAQEMTVGQLLAQVCRMTGHLMRGHMKRIGLHKGQGFALIHLWHKDGMPQRDLAQSMHISPASATNMLQRMERDGWIERRRDDEDQRVVRVFATAKAAEMRDQAKCAFQEIEDELNSIYTSEEQATLKQLLMKLHDQYATVSAHDHHSHDFLFSGSQSNVDCSEEVSADTEREVSG